MDWLSITLEMEPDEAEAFSEALLEAGAESVSLDPVGGPAADPARARMRLSALAAQDADAGALVAAAARCAALATPEFRLERIEDQDWIRRSQSQFGPIRISAALCIVPSWHEPPADAGAVVRLDPGLAFGTGSHVSTRLILQQLERCVRRASHAGTRVLDYGCGSGILAIAAAKLGAAEVDAVDIDPQSIAAAAQNAKANGVQMRVAPPETLPAGNYDLVLANILAGPLIALEPLLAARTRAGGRVLLSGILQSQAAEVTAAYARDFNASVAAVDEGWALVEGVRR